ncbi:MAG: hypothetical protein ABJC04_05090 [Verrucomicrobiota bacterium]
MAEKFEFISTTDMPALLAVNTPEWSSLIQATLVDLGYKTQKISTHLEFAERFSQVPYQLVMLEDTFAGTPLSDNLTLQQLQNMPMTQRRHCTVILFGESHETLNALQAFQLSVHAVVNYSEMSLVSQLAQKVVSENNLFLNNLRECQKRLTQ